MTARRGRRLTRVATLALSLSLAAFLIAPLDARPKPAGKPEQGAQTGAGAANPIRSRDAQFEIATWPELEGWAADDHVAAFSAFLISCRAKVAGASATRDARPMQGALVAVCRRALKAVPLDEAGAREFFEANFRPVRISKIGEKDGFITGYYEPIVAGSRVPTSEYTYPLYRRPKDLIHTAKRRKGHAFPNNGRVVRKVGKRKFAAYFDRAEIEDGALDGRHLEICWLKDPVDAFFIHIQGSARVRLEDGALLRVNYDAHNGLPYLPVGRVLIERKIYTRDEMSMERIRQWMNAHPEEGAKLRRMNKSYVFFRITGLSEHDEAIGAQGVALTAGRSIAVDKALHVYGTPIFISADLPIAGEAPTTKLRRLMIAQDTGSAIVGPARADIYFGPGELEGRVSGRLRHNGRFTMLVPRDIDPLEAAIAIPLPLARPADATARIATAPATAVGSPAAEIPLPQLRPTSAGASRPRAGRALKSPAAAKAEAKAKARAKTKARR